MAQVNEMDQVMVVGESGYWNDSREAVVEYSNPESAWVDVRYVDTNEVEQVQRDRVELV